MHRSYWKRTLKLTNELICRIPDPSMPPSLSLDKNEPTQLGYRNEENRWARILLRFFLTAKLTNQLLAHF